MRSLPSIQCWTPHLLHYIGAGRMGPGHLLELRGGRFRQPIQFRLSPVAPGGSWRLAAVVDEEAAAAALRPEAAPPTLLTWIPSPGALDPEALPPEPPGPPPPPTVPIRPLPRGDLSEDTAPAAASAIGRDEAVHSGGASAAGTTAGGEARFVVTRHSEGATATYLLGAGGGPEVPPLGTHINLLLHSC